MVRKLFFFLLLLAGWGVIFLPLLAESRVFHLALGARPSASLTQPWRSGALVQVLPQVLAESTTGSSPCPAAYAIQPGDTLGEIASRCAVPLGSLLAANPQVANPNQVAAGERLSIPRLEGRGGGDGLAVGLAGETRAVYAPGAVIEVRASGLPASVPVRVGIGLSSSGYRVLEQAASRADGRLSISMAIPSSAQPGETAFILVTAAGVPSVQVISPQFTITAP